MEVRDEPVDYMEGAARQKIEARGVAIARCNGTFAAVCLRIPGAFQAAGRRGSHGDDAPARRMRLVDGVDSGLRYGVELGVHLVLGRVVLVHDAEGVEAHFELDGFPTNPIRLQALDELGREVKARGGRRRRCLAARVHGLVQLFVTCVVFDVGRKGRVANGVKRLVERGERCGEARDALAFSGRGLGVLAFARRRCVRLRARPVDDFGGKRDVSLLVGEVHHGAAARFQTLAGAHEHLPDGLLVG